MQSTNHQNRWDMLKFLGGSKKRHAPSMIITTLLIVVFLSGFLGSSNFFRRSSSTLVSRWLPTIQKETLSSSTSRSSTITTQSTTTVSKTNTSYPHLRFKGYNLTHLWSFRVADDNYLRIARNVPCRILEYLKRAQIDLLDTCDYSSNNEFALENSIRAQKWLFEHQHPQDCSNKRFAIIHGYPWFGYGSIIHHIVWAFGKALADDRIAVYQSPGNWLFSACSSRNPDCAFLPITNCTIPTTNITNQTIHMPANMGVWIEPVHHPVFRNRTFNWYRAQLIFYLMRFKPETLNFVQSVIGRDLVPPSIDLHRPYISLYVRRSDKVQSKEMSQAYTLRRYFDLFDLDARRANISTIFINSEDPTVFNEFHQLNKEKQNYYKLISINVTRNVILRDTGNWSREKMAFVGSEFLTGLYIEANGDLHSGTLTSNWCRVVDEFRLVLGKLIPYYTPETKYLTDW